MDFILASGNRHKSEEIKSILGSDFGVSLMDSSIEIVEDGETFEENAIKKAMTVARATGKAAIADDSGLCVDFLGGAPGVRTARYAGENATNEQNIEKLLGALKGVPEAERGARFVCVIAAVFPEEDFKCYTFRGECAGRISSERAGEGGFGYDPIFFVDEYNCTMAQLGADVKNKISHRAAALRELAEFMSAR